MLTFHVSRTTTTRTTTQVITRYFGRWPQTIMHSYRIDFTLKTVIKAISMPTLKCWELLVNNPFSQPEIAVFFGQSDV